ncbi:HNH endonuclease [Lentzea jiangxiensis]|uniref:HNH endonuclease n=1 Tax=Lentzea jiangxiensis TaxID=641025 RepID=A0A1H0N6K2_9PSEU|nr:HNH endonuclease [Lentzea jiangxiensis]SDO88307.1 HNH endonuclease [Lentzea jiangxiensis]
MIRIARTDLPRRTVTALARATEKIRAVSLDERYKNATDAWQKSSVRTTVRAKLGEMAHGSERCMYCGESRGTSVDHFEPVARSPLRTFDWLNHLLACATCNSHEKREQFPVDAVGNPLLIDPTAEDPFDHLLLTLSLGVYRHLTAKGQATIEVCGLNRPGLARGRMHARKVVVLALREWDRARVRDSTDEMADYLKTVQDQPMADVCQSMLRQAFSPGADVVFSDAPDLLALLRRDDLRDALLR